MRLNLHFAGLARVCIQVEHRPQLCVRVRPTKAVLMGLHLI